MRDFVTLTINGKRHELFGDEAFMMLADYLRKKAKLPGTKIVCAEGDCGACTVLCLRSQAKRKPIFEPINSCIGMALQFDGAHIMTIEALKKDGLLSPVQDAMVHAHASQCGYCTPGFVMALTALFENDKDALTPQKVKNHLTGNLCRCTGYQSIIDAALKIDKESYTPESHRYYQEEVIDRAKEPIHIAHKSCDFFAPITLKEACAMRNIKPHMRIIGAATDLGVMHNKGKIALDDIISLQHIEELYQLKEERGRIVVGAMVTLSELRALCQRFSPEFARFLNIFASPQIKNVATLIGNIANGSPIADTVPFLMVSDGRIKVASMDGTREILITELYCGYKKLALKPSEIITEASFAITEASQFCRLYKVSQRKDLDIAAVNAAFSFEMSKEAPLTNPFIMNAKIAVGGVAANVIRLHELEAFLSAKTLEPELVEKAASLLLSSIKPLQDLRGSIGYRYALLDGLFRRFIGELQRSMHEPC